MRTPRFLLTSLSLWSKSRTWFFTKSKCTLLIPFYDLLQLLGLLYTSSFVIELWMGRTLLMWNCDSKLNKSIKKSFKLRRAQTYNIKHSCDFRSTVTGSDYYGRMVIFLYNDQKPALVSFDICQVLWNVFIVIFQFVPMNFEIMRILQETEINTSTCLVDFQSNTNKYIFHILLKITLKSNLLQLQLVHGYKTIS